MPGLSPDFQLAPSLGATLGRGALLQRRLPRPPPSDVGVRRPDPLPAVRTLPAVLLLAVSAGLIAAAVRLSTVLTGYEPLTLAAACLATAIVVMLPWRVLRVGLAGRPELRRADALRLALLGVWSASGIVGMALYTAYRWLRPGYLTAQYADYVARLDGSGQAAAGALADLTARRPWFEDPLTQALNSGLLLALAGTAATLLLVYRRRPRLRE